MDSFVLLTSFLKISVLHSFHLIDRKLSLDSKTGCVFCSSGLAIMARPCNPWRNDYKDLQNMPISLNGLNLSGQNNWVIHFIEFKPNSITTQFLHAFHQWNRFIILDPSQQLLYASSHIPSDLNLTSIPNSCVKPCKTLHIPQFWYGLWPLCRKL